MKIHGELKINQCCEFVIKVSFQSRGDVIHAMMLLNFTPLQKIPK